MKRSTWWIKGLGVLVACALVLPAGCRKETAPGEDEPTEREPVETEPAETEPAKSAPPEAALLERGDPPEKPRWDDSPFDLETSLEAEPDITVPGGLDGL
ncbi:MAG: hypothetical protein R6X20_07405 [Phycisphaerae bacterium]